MKVLVIQLARFGDILQTWPTLRALKRSNPGVELHVLGRERFKSAFHGVAIVDQFWSLDAKRILKPLATRQPDVDVSLNTIAELIGPLREEAFDKIINLSFSPVSSYLTEQLCGMSTEVGGYSRHHDGYLSIADDPSAFFFAQVGPGRANRVHLTDLFAHIAQVDLAESDWAAPGESLSPACLQEARPGFIAVHVGASDEKKTLSWMKWAQIVKGLAQPGHFDVVLIGADAESYIAAKIIAACPDLNIKNWVGRTKFEELFDVLKSAQLLVGGDSGPVHVASLTNTPVFNISFPSVSFWETGPRAVHSRVICVDEDAAVPSDTCATDIISVWHEIESAKLTPTYDEAPTQIPSFLVRDRSVGYELSLGSRAGDFACVKFDFQWQLVRAIYMGHEFPVAHEALFVEGVARLFEVNQVALDQIKTLKRQQSNSSCRLILDRVDEIIEQIARMVSDVGPLVRWFQTERLRLGPMSIMEVLAISESLHQRFADVLGLYHLQNDEIEPQASA